MRSRRFEILVIGTRERKNHGRDFFEETQEQTCMADGAALFEGNQVYLAEAAVLRDPKMEGKTKDKYKLVRCMRDSWNSQIQMICPRTCASNGVGNVLWS